MKKTQTPNPKHQRNTKDQTSNSGDARFGVWTLEFIWSLLFGFWCLCDRRAELVPARI